ncbi:MAG: SRPBCC family protein [Spirochaetaceae bacterium]|nr:SRPBCC family protein [Spirochaetaceae bacterium]MDT8299290.1 SRPBCC family protein [Spirochaetaceae bacterium]
MNSRAEIEINASPEKVWNVVTDIENSPNVIKGINSVDVLERPRTGLNGLKWKETRVLFGKEATEVMWITHSEENAFYQTRAESRGAVYISTVPAMEFRSELRTLGARIMGVVFAGMMRKAATKAFEEDLRNIKNYIEAG